MSLQQSHLSTPNSTTTKRKRTSPPDQKDRKLTPLAPIFQKHQLNFQWLSIINESCIHGTYGNPIPTQKIAAFDLDSTLITTKSGNTFPRNSDDWKLWNPIIPKKLHQLNQDGYTILLISNQKTNAKQSAEFDQKLPKLAKALNVPFRIFAARKDDVYRKPRTGIWEEFIKNWNGNLEPDKEQSFYVGDAAGRPSRGSIKADFSDTDRKWALNLDIPFFTPEEFFLNQSKRQDYVLKGFDPTKYDHDQPAWIPETSIIAYEPISSSLENVKKLQSNEIPKKLEIVLFVGPPAIGKSQFYKTHFEPKGYEHINQDKLKTFEKCLKSVKESIQCSKSCVIDNTNPSESTRHQYIKLSQDLGCSIRCIHFDSSIDLSLHNNVYRAFYGEKDAEGNRRHLLPGLAFGSYLKRFETPLVQEGFGEVALVRFRFVGKDVGRKKWEMYLT
ncbi:uncharacterized protein MELLADRAFT_89991 [Melampsora larici-populina 98AG31]|uniref:Polynucleotide kinase 3'-phosphatase n=1 Tax=Melampsora larici-populina (strain 98AG31 / pathotype 3-4-7) TaxID=747676 RepID=F4RVC5_MELLP|nr:uncharacterized protein MELLADRAFT_89991 [Melampsora larici-populina 98AG31]EGG03692.1 hypothetical protein MELLADRAFT_89991 [Melampsora larici-populina 98AG31]